MIQKKDRGLFGIFFICKKSSTQNFRKKYFFCLLIFIEVFAFLRLANQRLVFCYTLPQDAFRVDDANILAMSQTF